MGIKKLFHRNRDDSPQQSPNNSPGSPGTSGDPALRTSLYQSASPGGLPQTGDYPMKGNSNTQTSPSPGNRIRKYPNANTNQQNFPSNAPQPDLSAASSARPTAINRNDIAPTEPNNVVPPDMGSTVRAVDEGRDRNIEEPLSKGFSALSVGDEDSKSLYLPLIRLGRTLTGNSSTFMGKTPWTSLPHESAWPTYVRSECPCPKYRRH